MILAALTLIGLLTVCLVVCVALMLRQVAFEQQVLRQARERRLPAVT